MASANIVTLTAANFAEKVLQSKLPVMVDFSAEWCGPCKMLAPILDQVAEANKDKFVIGKLDIDQARDLAANYRISSVPTLMVFKNGEVTNQRSGLMSKRDLEAMF